LEIDFLLPVRCILVFRQPGTDPVP
jgi:hypothetical protein